MKNRPRIICLSAICIFTIFIFNSFTFQDKEGEKSIFEHLSFDEVIKVEIETDIDSLLNTKRSEEELPATFSYKDEKGKKRSWNVELQVRGKFRRRVCPFPPLFVNFSKKELEAAGFNDHNDLKLVTHCVDNEVGDENVLREYLTYKLYQILSPTHYRVQLVKVKYSDDNSSTGFTRYGILMEDEDEMRGRYASKVCDDCYSTPKDSFQSACVNTHDLFQYMIGNTDWSTPMLRNMKLLQPKDSAAFMLVPYDFDFSGLVKAPYASPDGTLGIKTVRERVFLGFAESVEELQPTIKIFQEQKPNLLNCIKKFKLLPSESRQDIQEYIESFYRCLDEGLDLKTPGKC
ncbi:MAG: hypothetical protein IPJ74_27255 [Saprospiraceae bacterium]|nr:hypothetical protein [Saprospiraceae bacterium]